MLLFAHPQQGIGALVDNFTRLPIERLCLRIDFRTAVCPARSTKAWEAYGTETGLAYWSQRRSDVAGAAEAEGLTPYDSLREIDAKRVVRFTVKPVTVRSVLNSCSRASGFPSTRLDRDPAKTVEAAKEGEEQHAHH